MKVLDTTHVQLERVDLARMRQHPWTQYELIPGTVGVATIVKAIAIKIGKFTADDRGDEIGLRVVVGMGWEAIAAQFYPDLWWQPGAFHHNGISGHPDGFGEVLIPNPVWCVDEFKYTAKSLRVPGGRPEQKKSILDEWMWQCQVMAYIKLHPAYDMMNEKDPLYARFHVCWAMNNYTKYTLDEVYLRYLVEYERDEIERNWTMLEDNRDLVARQEI